MLTDCAAFRSAPDPRRDHPHLRACSSCATWFETLDSAVAALSRPPELPATLRRALLAIGSEEGPCPDPDILAEAASTGRPDADLALHLATCETCGAIVETLRAFRPAGGDSGGASEDPDAAPFPASLRERLVAIPEPRREVPRWLRWGDVGSLAASFVLTAFLTLVAGDSAASLFREPPTPRLGWVDLTVDQAREGWSSLRDQAHSRWSELAARAEHWSERVDARAAGFARPFDDRELDSPLPPSSHDDPADSARGDHHDRDDS